MTKLPPPRPTREIPGYQTPTPATPTTINHTAGTVVATLGKIPDYYSNGRKGRGLPFWLNREIREETIRDSGVHDLVASEEELWEFDENEEGNT